MDLARLGRQIYECTQLARLLRVWEDNGKLFGLNFAPVVKLWISTEGEILIPELRQYQYILNARWAEVHDGQSHKSLSDFSWVAVGGFRKPPAPLTWPTSVYASHRSKLLLKDHGHYSRAFKHEKLDVEEGIGYAWLNPSKLID